MSTRRRSVEDRGGEWDDWAKMRTPPSSSRSATIGHATRWRVVIPVKDTTLGKSRLAHVAGEGRQRLNRAIADDTVGAAVAALGADRVLLVTADPALRSAWADAGVSVLDDPGGGLNAAVSHGFSALRDTRDPVAALLGDLPALRSSDLALALTAAASHRLSFVPDAAGTGTVLLCQAAAVSEVMPLPRFGPASALRHTENGAHRLDLDLPSLRTDVDDDASLAAAEALGLGAATRAALAVLRAGAPRD